MRAGFFYHLTNGRLQVRFELIPGDLDSDYDQKELRH
jgi:hypothetical protein